MNETPPAHKAPTARAIEIIAERGFDLMRSDLFEIELQFVFIPFDDLLAETGHVYEALALIVNDPAYQGDIPPIA